MIQTFADKDLEAVYRGKRVKRFAQVGAALERKLRSLDEAETLRELQAVPGNQLERLYTGEFSIRLNIQWRLVFRWTDSGPQDVRLEDYH
ncbi:MAG TPA: type II toxin-antitoxin system RelE/ParE family toxin [Verrucomicrobiae bacterium]|nr:type II toxin-antitoxin system RelE/ParE family toxin [Verrucomicrobiae bacterium]